MEPFPGYLMFVPLPSVCDGLVDKISEIRSVVSNLKPTVVSVSGGKNTPQPGPVGSSLPLEKHFKMSPLADTTFKTWVRVIPN
jgi:hypothetical protein